LKNKKDIPNKFSELSEASVRISKVGFYYLPLITLWMFMGYSWFAVLMDWPFRILSIRVHSSKLLILNISIIQRISFDQEGFVRSELFLVKLFEMNDLW